MAALRGVMDYGHHANSISRLAHDRLSASLKTWHTTAYATIDRYGRARVEILRDGKEIHAFYYDVPEIPHAEMEKDISKREKRRR